MMMKKEKYINEILQYIDTDRKTKKRIKEDLEMRIEEAIDQDPYFNLVESMGAPLDVANEFMENLGIENGNPHHYVYEYKSEKTLFGLPLVHIHYSGGRGSRMAKGIVAIGDMAVGVVSLGGVSIGLISIGGVSIGALALGGVAIGGVALGGVALGLVALGGAAFGLLKVFGAAGTVL
jgi:hypothetical protein